MATITPPTVINSFRQNPVDKTGLMHPVTLPRANQHLSEQMHTTLASKPADKAEISAEARKLATKNEAQKVATPLPAPAQGKPLNLLA